MKVKLGLIKVCLRWPPWGRACLESRAPTEAWVGRMVGALRALGAKPKVGLVGKGGRKPKQRNASGSFYC